MQIRNRIIEMMSKRGWSLYWTHRSSNLFLEVAELTEAIRGKNGDSLEESADVLMTLLAFSPYDLDEIVLALEKKLQILETKPIYKGEDYEDRKSKL